MRKQTIWVSDQVRPVQSQKQDRSVFGWDFGLVLSKVFIACVRQLYTIFVFIYFFFFMNSPGEVIFGVVPVKTLSCVPDRVDCLHHTCPLLER